MSKIKGASLTDLHITLMEELDRLMDCETEEEIMMETKRAKSVSIIANQIVNNTANVIKANEVALEYGYKPVDNQLLIEEGE